MTAEHARAKKRATRRQRKRGGASLMLRLIRRCAEWQPRDRWRMVPRGLRGIYVLLRKRRASGSSREMFDVVYIGMARGGKGIRHRGIRRRPQLHMRSRRKRDAWTHFSLYEAWPNISDDEVGELEGLLRHIYRKTDAPTS